MFLVGSYLGIVRNLIQRLCGIEVVLLREMEGLVAGRSVDVVHLCRGLCYSIQGREGERGGNAKGLSLASLLRSKKEKVGHLCVPLEQSRESTDLYINPVL